MQQIRITKTQELEKVLSYLKDKYRLLSEAEIIKLALSEIHNKEVEATREKEQKLREEFYHAIEEGGKVGDKLLAKKGLKQENMTEQQIYDTFLNAHKHKS